MKVAEYLSAYSRALPMNTRAKLANLSPPLDVGKVAEALVEMVHPSPGGSSWQSLDARRRNWRDGWSAAVDFLRGLLSCEDASAWSKRGER